MNNDMKFYSNTESPCGPLLLFGNGDALTGLYMPKQKYAPEVPAHCQRDDRVFYAVRKQLAAYFAGELKEFDVPLAPAGTVFQKKVWKALLDIRFGAVESYGALAKRIHHDKASRAVGLANGRNPIGIIVPCHRVLGANGSLTGYGGGIERKQWLLKHEQTFAAQQVDSLFHQHA